MSKRRMLLVPVGSIAMVMAFVAIAYSCTAIQGTATIESPSDGVGGSPGSVSPGDSISVSASGALNNHTYKLKFLNHKAAMDTMLSCMGWLGETALSGNVTSNGSGTIAATSGTIPSNATPGIASVCFIDDGYANATEDDLLVIL